MVKALVEREGIQLNLVDRWGGTALADAVRHGHAHVAAVLRAAGAVLKLSASDASSQLCEMARLGDTAKLTLLLECGCDASAADYDGRTAAHLAASEGQTLIVQVRHPPRSLPPLSSRAAPTRRVTRPCRLACARSRSSSTARM